jgi:4-hydroxy-2-oxoheptanedioate aldolase
MSGPSFSLRQKLEGDRSVIFPWIGNPGDVHAGQIARMGFDAVALDLQHGTIDNGEAARMTAAINATGTPTVVRILWNDPGLVGFALDMGAAAIIAPMTNSVAQAQAFVKAAKYPPLGQRSWGGYTMVQASGVTPGEYLKQANDQTLAIAMIETQEALDAVDEIASVKGLDGLFVGPSDLSIALTKGAGIDRLGAHTLVAMEKVAAACKKHGLIAGAFGGTPEGIKAYSARGFRFMAGPTDTDLLRSGATAFQNAIKG